MVLQSTPSVQELLPRTQTGAAAKVSPAETPFKDLLDGALQARTEPPQEPAKAAQSGEQPEQSPKEEQPSKDAIVKGKEQPVQAEKPRKPVKEAQTQEAATVVATLIAPIIPTVLELAPVQTSTVTEPTQIVELTAAPVETVLPTGEQPAPQSQATFVPVAQPQVPTQLVSAMVEPQLQAEPVVQEQGVVVEMAADVAESVPAVEGDQLTPKIDVQPRQEKADPNQEKFDSLIAKASRELPAPKVRTGQPKDPEQQEIPSDKAPTLSKGEGRAQIKVEPEEKSREPKAQETQTAPKELSPVQIRGMQAAQPLKPMAAPTPTQQVEAQVLQHLEQGKTEFRMQLAPKELGRVDVRMLLEDGKLTVQILTATSKAAQELQRSGESLTASLRMAGAQLETVQIVHRPEEPSQQMGGAFNMENGQHPSGESHHGQSSRHQGQGTEWEEETYRTPETPSRLLDQAI